MADEQWPQIEAGKPVCYRIAVQGCLDAQKWSGRVGRMRIASQKAGDQQAVTILNGEVQDQAELMGVLNTLYQMRMNILSAVCEPCDEPAASHSASSRAFKITTTEQPEETPE